MFLDLERYRYFYLRPALEEAFHSFVEDPASCGASAAALAERGVLRMIDGEHDVHPVRYRPPTGSADAIGIGSTTAVDVLQAILCEVRVSSQIRSGGIASIIAALRARESVHPLPAVVTDRRPASAIRAFEVAKLFRSPADRCLSRSIAMVQRLARRGCAAQLVLGVRAEPFAAHSWAQAGDLILNDSLEEVSRFSPILVV